MNHDVVIAGGGIVGSSTALHLLRAEPGLRVLIVEPDTSFTEAATPRASGGVRRLFSRPENIALSQYTLTLIAEWRAYAGEDAPDLLWRQDGYLFVAAPDQASTLRDNLEVQQSHGVEAVWLDPSELAGRFPAMRTDDLGGAVLSPGDGWLDPHAMLAGTLAAARRLGAHLRRDRVVGFSPRGTRIESIVLESGETLTADAVVNAAGCWAPELAARAGMPLPVEPVTRLEHHVRTPEPLGALPFVKDPAGLAVRPDGPGLSVGLVDFGRPLDSAYFDRVVWPALAHRFPPLDRLRLHATSMGQYDLNRLDGNPVIGNWPGHLDNFYVATGFSGHGLMHAPGVGRALTELIITGGYQTIDLTRLGHQRILTQTPYPEHGIR